MAMVAGLTAGFAADPQEAWEQAVKAKGGRDRLHSVRSLAVFMKPSVLRMTAPGTNWLCVFPDRYFEYDGTGPAGNRRALVVDLTADRTAEDTTGIPRHARHVSAAERDRLALNQIVFLLESAWLQPKPVAMRRNVLVVEASSRTYQLSLNRDNLPERILSPPVPGQKPKIKYDFRLQQYRDFQGVMLPARVTFVSDVHEATWDADYEVDAKYNPKLFERMPDLANGPEPWRQR